MAENINFDSGPENSLETERNKRFNEAQKVLSQIGDYMELDNIADQDLYNSLASQRIEIIRNEFENIVDALAGGLDEKYFSADDIDKCIQGIDILSSIDPARVEETLKKQLIYPETLSRIRNKMERELNSKTLTGRLKNIFGGKK